MNQNKTLLAGTMGWPVKHSRSPLMHGYWIKQYNVNGKIVLLETRPENLEKELKTLAARGFVGTSITLPHKEEALKYIDEVDRLALRVGAVNQVVVNGKKLKGFNSDVFGFMENIKGITVGTAMVLGAGGASRAVIVGLQEMGFSEIRISNRTKSRAEKICKELGDDIKVVDWEDKERRLGDIALLVNTTSLGMAGQPQLEINLDGLSKKAIVTDIVYTPLETAFLKQARVRGNKTIDGLGMLLHQGRPAFKAWFGIDPEVTDELRAVVLAG